LNQHQISISEISSSSSSRSSTTTSSTTSAPPKENQNQSQGKRRFCLVWEILPHTIKVLPIASFGNRILSNSNITSHSSSSNEFFLKRVISIAPTPSPPNKRPLYPIITQDSFVSLRGYLLLLPIEISTPKVWPKPKPVHFSQDDLLYINSSLLELIKEEQENRIKRITYSTKILNVTDADDNNDDHSSHWSSDSLPIIRGHSSTRNDLNSHHRIEQWLEECKLKTSLI